MKVKVMLKIKATTGKEAKLAATHLINQAFVLEEAAQKEVGRESVFQSWGFLKEFKK